MMARVRDAVDRGIVRDTDPVEAEARMMCARCGRCGPAIDRFCSQWPCPLVPIAS